MPAFGQVDNPLTTFGGGYGDVSDAGVLISNIVKLVLVAGGVTVLFITLFAGFSYITAGGDTKKIETALYSINMALTGIVIMVGAIVITGIVSWVLFGSPTVILSPQVYGPGSF